MSLSHVSSHHRPTWVASGCEKLELLCLKKPPNPSTPADWLIQILPTALPWSQASPRRLGQPQTPARRGPALRHTWSHGTHAGASLYNLQGRRCWLLDLETSRAQWSWSCSASARSMLLSPSTQVLLLVALAASVAGPSPSTCNFHS